jgi:CHRD domain-containing protein
MNRSMTVAMMFAVAACAGSQASKTDASSSGTSSSGSMSSSGTSSSGMSSSGMQAGAQSFRATLDSGSETPQPNVGSATPSGTATFDVEGQTIKYNVDAKGLSSPFTVAHIHVGDPGTPGPVVVPLAMTDSGGGNASGSGTLDASGIKGKNPDGSPMSMQDVIALLGSGKAYVNVHTQNNKSGEIRGQIQAAR